MAISKNLLDGFSITARDVAEFMISIEEGSKYYKKAVSISN